MMNFSHKENNEAFMASEARKLLFVDNFLKKKEIFTHRYLRDKPLVCKEYI